MLRVILCYFSEDVMQGVIPQDVSPTLISVRDVRATKLRRQKVNWLRGYNVSAIVIIHAFLHKPNYWQWM